VGRLVAWGTIPIGSLAAGLSLSAVGATWTLIGLTAVATVVAIAGTATAHVRRAPRVETLEPAL
jgi:hypothetical protein